ncbi:MAG: DNA repair protein RecO [Candidatus Sungbacteria bacterium]|nr:DNA repair protein RecO [Candidatus Sungbacteria bacterium]
MHHTTGLVLKKDEWKETDLLITALTRDFGKIRFLVQGARKHGAKLQGHIEPGSVSELSFVASRNGYRLTAAELLRFFPGTRDYWPGTAAVQFVLRILEDNLWEERDNAAVLFETTCEILSRLGDGGGNSLSLRRALVWYQVKFLNLLGVLPSSQSQEASFFRDLISLNSLPLEAAEDLDVSVLEAELTRLVNLLGSAVRIPPYVAPADSFV